MPQYSGQAITCTNCNKAFVVPGTPTISAQPMEYASSNYLGPQESNSLATASFVVALVGLIIPVIPGIAAIVLGIVGISRTRNRNVGGKGFAIAGIAIGATSIVTSLVITGCFMSILLPSLNRARETANRVKCASNMRQIGLALLQYANDHHGQYPPRLEELILDGNINSNVFVCPDSIDTPAPGSTPQAQAAALSSGGHESYIYVPNLNSSVSAETIVLYEPLSDHAGQGMNILFGDGHVEFDPNPSAGRMIAELQAGFNPPRRGHY